MDWPVVGPPNSVMITPHSLQSIGTELAAIASSAPASAAWPAANRAIFVPFTVNEPFIAQKVFWVNGTTTANNADVGIYDEFGTKIVSSGGVAKSGNSAIQESNIADTLIGRGRFYLAAASDSTGTWFRVAPNLEVCKAMGLAQMASAYTLPATATLAVMTSAYVPFIGVAGRALAA